MSLLYVVSSISYEVTSVTQKIPNEEVHPQGREWSAL